MHDEQDREEGAGIGADCRCGVGPRQRRLGPRSSATQSPSAERSLTRSPAASKAAVTSASRSMKMPEARASRRAQLGVQCGRERDEHAGDEVGEDDVERRARRSGASLGARRSGASSRLRRGVRDGRFDGDRIGVDTEGRRCAELECGDRQDARAAADVEHAGPVDAGRVGDTLERGQAQAGRRVQARPERHARVEREHDVVGSAAVSPPGRADDEPPPDAQDREVAPSRPPPSPPRARSGSAARRSAAGRTPGDGRAPRRPRPRRPRPRPRRAPGTYAANHGRPARIDPGAESLVDEVERRLDGRAAGGDPAEDLADRLDRLEVRLDRELQPGPGRPARRVVRAPTSPTGRACRGCRRAPRDRLAGILRRTPRATRAASWSAWSAPRRRP